MNLQNRFKLTRAALIIVWSKGTTIGSGPAILSIIKMIDQVAKSTATILISGESGTGKELAARAIHYHSDRKNKPFITVNCIAMPEQIIESELFGHVKGSFTGAWKDKRGIIEGS